MTQLIDRVGLTFGLWTIVELYERGANTNSGKPKWLCECACAAKTRKPICWNKLRKGRTKSCGCAKYKSCSPLRSIGVKQTLTTSLRRKLFKIWRRMGQRCYNPKHHNYEIYGGRNIYVAPEWHNFEQFFQDMHETYKPGLTIERKNNNGPYSKSNCRWATTMEQNNNQRRNIFVETPLGRMTVAQASRAFNVADSIIRRKIEKGIPAEEIYDFLTAWMAERVFDDANT